ncbi:MAG: hypothetical protein JO129_03080 [Candidatus Dependentiae bacterium]|nr:hypothetical protein [Candidatus Dependentiae bacterium]
MWPLRQNVQYNKRYFFKDIFIFVFVSHVILLAIIFLCDSGKFHQERFAINSNNLQSTVVFIPLKKRVVQQQKTVDPRQKKDGDRKIINYDEYQKKVLAASTKTDKIKSKKDKKIKSAPKKKEIAPQIAKSTIKKDKVTQLKSEKKSPTLLQQDHKKKSEKKSEKVVLDKKKKVEKQKSKKPEPVIEKKEKKEESNIESIAPVAQEQKIEPVKIEEQIVPVIESSTEKQEELLKFNASENDIDLEQISFVGSHDLEIIQIKEQIQVEVEKYYRPPVGIAKKAICEMAVLVGAHGKAERVTVKKGSGSMANDICARAALLKVTFPKEVIGKEIIVELGQ